jgi:hypothetical protein
MRAVAVMLWCGAAVLAAPAVTHADDIAKVAQARTAFERGAAFASEERWGDALSAFTESALLRPHATTTYNIGFCERALGRAVRARKHFALALAQDQTAKGAELTPELRAASKKYLEEVRTQIATPTIVVPPEVTITIDGRPLEAADAGLMLAGTRDPGPGEKVPSGHFVLEIDAGAHEIVIAAPDGRNKVAHEYFPAATTKELKLDLPPLPPPPLVDHGRTRRVSGYILGAAGVVGVGIGAYFGLAARSTWSEAKDKCPSRTSCSDESVQLSTDARKEANVATVAFVAGGAAIVGGTILILTGAPPSERAHVGAVIDPRGLAFLSLSGSF